MSAAVARRDPPSRDGSRLSSQLRQAGVEGGELVAHLAAELVDERGRVERFAQGDVVGVAVGLEVVHTNLTLGSAL